MSCDLLGVINIEVIGTKEVQVTLLASWNNQSPPTNPKFSDVYLTAEINTFNKFTGFFLEGTQNVYLKGQGDPIGKILEGTEEPQIYLTGKLCQ